MEHIYQQLKELEEQHVRAVRGLEKLAKALEHVHEARWTSTPADGLCKARERAETARVLGVPSGRVVGIGARPQEEMSGLPRRLLLLDTNSAFTDLARRSLLGNSTLIVRLP
jgi:hypothetical protein